MIPGSAYGRRISWTRRPRTLPAPERCPGSRPQRCILLTAGPWFQKKAAELFVGGLGDFIREYPLHNPQVRKLGPEHPPESHLALLLASKSDADDQQQVLLNAGQRVADQLRRHAARNLLTIVVADAVRADKGRARKRAYRKASVRSRLQSDVHPEGHLRRQVGGRPDLHGS